MKKSIIIVIISLLFTGCEQISKSIKDTLEPKTDTTAQLKNKEVPVSAPSPYDVVVEKQLEDVQHLVTTIMEKHTKTNVRQYTEGKNTDFLTSEEKLKKAEEALRKLPQYAGKKIYVYSNLHFSQGGNIYLQLQHPTHPEYIDNYKYENGSWSDPKPEMISIREDIHSRLIPLDKVSFINVAKAAATYNEKANQIEGAEPINNIYISVRNNSLMWSPGTIEGSRERYSIELNQNGTLKKFERE
ncbi:hypothetical protein CLU96_2696 [Chryseobacterium sp. 52]|uniref:hypothetical protein n=1 Tax=Chryseobacterium sp. 52 TaxID=2035213 RepID=UPI000C19FDAD|nr:hypothetical protein [Chryseobacterium sp. 52]PIF45686.1 hypothetical protein CLU96_2696 [Chryseobacterium sp. 52]